MLGKRKVVNIDICSSFSLKHSVGTREMLSLHSDGSQGKYKRHSEGLVGVNS